MTELGKRGGEAPRFKIGDRVRIREGRSEFGGVGGRIAVAPESAREFMAADWHGHFAYERRRRGVVRIFWVWFDQPADDGSGDGPYRGTAIEEDSLELVDGSS
jgi:hypothetical protein